MEWEQGGRCHNSLTALHQMNFEERGRDLRWGTALFQWVLSQLKSCTGGKLATM